MGIRPLFSNLVPLLRSIVRVCASFIHARKRHITSKRLLFIGGGLLLGLSLAYTVSFYWPRTLAFSYAGGNCFTNPVLFPAIAAKEKRTGFDAAPSRVIAIAHYPIYAHDTCITATEPPKENSSEDIFLALRGNSLLKKQLTITSGKRPEVRANAIPVTPVSTKDPLSLPLDSKDTVFAYQLEANGRQAPCSKQNQSLKCDVPKLNLGQGTQYTFVLYRLFDGRPVEVLLARKLTTVEPVQITNASIAGGQMIYHIPTELTVTLNKPVESVADIRLEAAIGEERREVAVTTSFTGNTLTLRFNEPLPRSAAFNLTIGQVGAPDGGYLAAPFSLSFATSGGPKVAGVSIGSARVQPGGNIVITFDTPMAAGQNLSQFIRLETGAGPVAAAITAQGRRVTISPAALPRCTPFTVKVLDGLKNEHGVSGGSAWQLNSRTLCQTVFSIGASVQGRAITAYRFGEGPNKIIVVGGTHGDEKSSVYILNEWVDQLESNPTRIPAHQTIVVIPTLNPDGYAANRRTNANNVDLNRNFPSNNWKSGVSMPNGEFLAHGGGTHPLSEPESSALASYVSGQNPRLVLTYHAAGSVVIPNHSGDSDQIAVEYGRLSTVGYRSSGSGMFHYDTTGAFEDWLHDKRGTPALLIELSTRTSFDYGGHRNALWYIAGL